MQLRSQLASGSTRRWVSSLTVMILRKRSNLVRIPLLTYQFQDLLGSGAKVISDAQVIKSLKGQTRDIQMSPCLRPRYAKWGKCTQCISKHGGDSCRFRDFRVFELAFRLLYGGWKAKAKAGSTRIPRRSRDRDGLNQRSSRRR